MPRWLAGLSVSLRSLLRGRRADQELDEEFQYHLDRQIDEGVTAGLTADQARDAALRSMGAIDRSKEECRDLRRANLLGHLLEDLRYAARTLRRSPGFAMLAVVIMALGIGANTAVFSVVNAVLLKSLPYSGADRLVTLSSTVVTTGEINPLVVIANLRDWREQSASFEAMATYTGGQFPVSAGTEAEFVNGAIVDPDLLRVFAVRPVIGRGFVAETSAPGSRSALISYAYWRSRFGGDADVVQRSVRVGGADTPIVGVLPQGFRFPGDTDVWIADTATATSRTRHNRFAVGRLRPNVSLEQAQAELTTIATRLGQAYPDSNKGRGVAAGWLQDRLVGSVRVTLYLLWGVVGIVLLIACANTATLLLGRAAARRREIAVRTAVGASRLRIVQQLIAESLVLALVAGALGMMLAFWGAEALVALAPFDVVRSAGIGIDGGVLAFTLVVSLATSVLFGLVPALHASKVDLTEAVKQGRSVTGGRTIRTRGLLVVSEIALAVVLMTAAGLLTKSLIALYNVDLGFRADNVLVMKATGVRSIRENNAYFTDVIARIGLLPEVVAVGATSIPPGELSNSGSGAYFIDRRPETRDRATEAQALYTVVTSGAFAALGIPLKSGRDFDDGDIVDRPLVAIVNESLVRRSFAGENPIGRTILCSFDRPNDGMTIVGVVGDVRQRNPAIEPLPECYMPYRQHTYNNATLYVVSRTTGDPAALAGTVRRVAMETSPNVPVSFTTMDAIVSERVASPRFRTLLFGLFAVLAVCLAMAGVYGVMAFAVEQRSKEIGLRMALGATRRSVLQLVLGQGLVLASIGLAIGLAGAVAATRLLTTVLFEVQPIDTQVFLGVVVALGLVTLLAGYVPGRRATDVDPVEVLKAD